MTPKPGPKIEITPETRLGDLLGRRVRWRHYLTGQLRGGTVISIDSAGFVRAETPHHEVFSIAQDELYEVDGNSLTVSPDAKREANTSGGVGLL